MQIIKKRTSSVSLVFVELFDFHLTGCCFQFCGYEICFTISSRVSKITEVTNTVTAYEGLYINKDKKKIVNLYYISHHSTFKQELFYWTPILVPGTIPVILKMRS